jgi:diguanylate cyclase (GGDEF)-like protein
MSKTAFQEKKIRHRLLLMHPRIARAGRLIRAMRDAGWEVLAAEEHLQCLQIVRGGDVDMVLLCLPVAETADMDLPRVIRQVASCAYLPVVIVADRQAERLCCRFLDSGADEIVIYRPGSGGERASHARTVSRIRALLRVKDLSDRLEGASLRLRHALRRERRAASRLRRDNESLRGLAWTDPLTGLHNLRAFQAALDHAVKAARRYSRPIGLLMIDVDRFKRINDECGHPAGDRALKRLAEVLRQCVRDSDIAARIGGDEIAVLLPGAGRKDAMSLARRIRLQVRRDTVIAPCRKDEGSRPRGARPGTWRMTVSVGLATWSADAGAINAGALMRAADDALLRAKAWRDCVQAAA